MKTPKCRWSKSFRVESEDEGYWMGDMAREMGYVAIHCVDRGWVSVWCTPSQFARLKAAWVARRTENRLAWERFTLVWQRRMAAPTSVALFGWHFRSYVAARWFDSRHPCPSAFPGPNAGAPELISIAAKVCAGAPLELDAPDVRPVWLEYLSEYHERFDQWTILCAQNVSVSAFPIAKCPGGW